MPEGIGADQGGIGEAGTVERDNEAANSHDKLVIELHGEEEKKHVVGKNGDDKSVSVEDTTGERQRTDHVTVGREPLQGLVQGFGKNIPKGDGATDGDTKVNSVRFEGQVRPWAQEQGLTDRGVSGGV